MYSNCSSEQERHQHQQPHPPLPLPPHPVYSNSVPAPGVPDAGLRTTADAEGCGGELMYPLPAVANFEQSDEHGANNQSQ